MKNKYVIILIFVYCFLYGQQTEQWINKLENPKYSSLELKENNLKEKYFEYDFSTLLVPKSNFLGFIGDEYRRLRIFFTRISKNNTKPDIYEIKGISLVNENKCDFKGTIKITQVREYKNMHYGCDDEFKDEGFKAQGLLIGNYKFNEDHNQDHSGTFEGVMTLFWFVDRYNIMHYDNLKSHYSDSYCNNQYIGKWTGYNKSESKICNWGEYRIPFSGDLDIGASYFSPNPKYSDKGWSHFSGIAP